MSNALCCDRIRWIGLLHIGPAPDLNHDGGRRLRRGCGYTWMSLLRIAYAVPYVWTNCDGRCYRRRNGMLLHDLTCADDARISTETMDSMLDS